MFSQLIKLYNQVEKFLPWRSLSSFS
uniref:Uncharacterized protein n=1 Tax=Arundo donax TaxID=35708 RepID=A0A0A9ANP0_ARUDO